MTAPEQLKLIALDADDLAVISAHVQDARVQASDIVWRQDEKRLVVGLDRLDWEQTLSGGTEPRRSIAALRFDRGPRGWLVVGQWVRGRGRMHSVHLASSVATPAPSSRSWSR